MDTNDKKKFEQMVADLETGSENVNKMRIKVCTMINMMSGLVKKFGWANVGPRRHFRTTYFLAGHGHCQWLIEVDCDSISHACFRLGSDTLYVHEGQWINYECVQIVYEQRWSLLQLFLSTFPELEEKIQPFIKAAGVQL